MAKCEYDKYKQFLFTFCFNKINNVTSRSPNLLLFKIPNWTDSSHWKRKDPLIEMFLIQYKPIVGPIVIDPA